MPKPTYPPTPAPSTDIKGRDQLAFISQQHNGFELPPSAIGSRSNSASSREAHGRAGGPTLPDSPPYDDASLRKRSFAQANADTTLPPPPSRSRKIIQVKPKEQQQQSKRQSIDDAEYEPGSKAAPTGGGGGGGGGGGKKKGSTTSAGRKIARKTAHSLIERRRRSKMNEEFGVLKDLIPACRGHEMHKLAILQASIDYLRYLENCITELKSDGRHSHSIYSPQPRMDSSEPVLEAPSSDDDAEDDDEEMQDHVDALPPPPPTTAPRSDVHSVSVSTATVPASSAPSPALPNFVNYRDQRHYSLASSEAPSPFLGAQTGNPRDWHSARPQSQSSYPASPTVHSTQTSPMLLPQAQSSELDREASAALLMLNASDRRTSMSQPAKMPTEVRHGNMKGISVKDLLSN